MDLYCSKCGEPWELDTMHDVADENNMTFNEAVAFFRKKGCAALDASCNEPANEGRAMAFTVLHDLMGDDVDGIAAMLEDFDVDNW